MRTTPRRLVRRAAAEWRNYNNVFVNNRRTHAGSSQSTGNFSGMLTWNMSAFKRGFVNNIIVGQPADAASWSGAIRWRMDGGADFLIDHNLYWDYGTPVAFAHREDGADIVTHSLSSWQQELASHGPYAYLGGKDAHSLETDPAFVSVPSYPADWDESWSFHLSEGSPARDAGGVLTFTTAAGSAAELSVDDAGYFFDGFGVVDGDRIVIGADAPVEIVAVDHDGHVLSLAESRPWSESDPVRLPFVGSAPDIGAFELGQGGDGGAGGGVTGGAGGAGLSGGSGVAGAGTPTLGATDGEDEGCGCRLVNDRGSGHRALVLVFTTLLVGIGRRRLSRGQHPPRDA